MSKNQRALRATQVAGRRVSPGTARQIHAARQTAAGTMIDAVPPSKEAVRAAIAEGKCPFCGSGPWKMLPVHTNKKHGVDKWQLRDLAGLTTSDALCDSDTLGKMSARNQRTSEEMAAISAMGSGSRAVADRRWTRAGRDSRGKHLRQWIAEHPEEVADLRAGFKERVTSPEVRAKWLAAQRKGRAERIYSEDEIRAFRERMASPSVEAKRVAHRERTRTVTCSIEGCTAPHVARGLCHAHWSKWDRERKRKPLRANCLSCGGPMDAQRPTRKFCSSACKQREGKKRSDAMG